MLLPQGKEGGTGEEMFRASEMLRAAWSVEQKAYIRNPPFPWIPGISNEDLDQLMPLLRFPRFQGEFFTAANSKGRKKSLTSSGEDPITQPKLYNLLGRLFREIRILKASVHDPKNTGREPELLWKASLHSECLKRSEEHRKRPPPPLAAGWTELVAVSAPSALDSSLHAPAAACLLFANAPRCLTGDASKLRPVQQQVDFFFFFFFPVRELQ